LATQCSGGLGFLMRLIKFRIIILKSINKNNFNGIIKRGENMNLDKLKKNIDSANVIEELIMLSNQVLGKSSDNVKNIIEMFIIRSYSMGKKNMVKNPGE